MKTVKNLIATTALSLLFIGTASATDYAFTARCQDGALVHVWKTGDIDPGKEYLRVVTGTKNPGCSIGDFNPTQDGYLPQEIHEGIGGVLSGTPLDIIGNIFGW